jgi:hypothetical protein
MPEDPVDPRRDGPTPAPTQHGLTQDEMSRLLQAIDDINSLASRIEFNGRRSVTFSRPFPAIIVVQTQGPSANGADASATMYTIATTADMITPNHQLTHAAKNGPVPFDPPFVSRLVEESLRFIR